MKKNIQIIMLLLLSSMLFACASVKTKAVALSQNSQQSSGSSGSPSDYILGPDDVVHITVEQHPEWSGDFTIRPDGNILLQNVGNFHLDGLTKDTGSIAIAAFLEKYINDPRVSIEIVKYASQAIYVFGEVNRPGKFNTEGKYITLRDAVLMAGIPQNFAALDRVFVIVPSASSKKPTQEVVNLDRILYKGEMKRNIQIKPGYIVYVPRTILGEFVNFIRIILSPVTSSIPAAKSVIAP